METAKLVRAVNDALAAHSSVLRGSKCSVVDTKHLVPGIDMLAGASLLCVSYASSSARL